MSGIVLPWIEEYNFIHYCRMKNTLYSANYLELSDNK